MANVSSAMTGNTVLRFNQQRCTKVEMSTIILYAPNMQQEGIIEHAQHRKYIMLFVDFVVLW